MITIHDVSFAYSGGGAGGLEHIDTAVKKENAYCSADDPAAEKQPLPALSMA